MIAFQKFISCEVSVPGNAAYYQIIKVPTDKIESSTLRRSIQLSYHSHTGEWVGLEPTTSGSTSEVTASCNAVVHHL